MRNAARRDKSSWTNDDFRRHPDRSKKNTLCTSIADVFSAKINEHSRFRNLVCPRGPNFPGLSEIQATQHRVREQRTSVNQPAEKIQNKFKKHHQVETRESRPSCTKKLLRTLFRSHRREKPLRQDEGLFFTIFLVSMRLHFPSSSLSSCSSFSSCIVCLVHRILANLEPCRRRTSRV